MPAFNQFTKKVTVDCVRVLDIKIEMLHQEIFQLRLTIFFQTTGYPVGNSVLLLRQLNEKNTQTTLISTFYNTFCHFILLNRFKNKTNLMVSIL